MNRITFVKSISILVFLLMQLQLFLSCASTSIGTQTAESYYKSGNAHYEAGRYDQAVADFTKAIGLNLNLAEAYNDRGIAYATKEDYDLAIADFTRAIDIDLNDAETYYNRGNAYLMKGDYARARSDWAEALRLDPKHANALNNLEVFRKLGY